MFPPPALLNHVPTFTMHKSASPCCLPCPPVPCARACPTSRARPSPASVRSRAFYQSPEHAGSPVGFRLQGPHPPLGLRGI